MERLNFKFTFDEAGGGEDHHFSGYANVFNIKDEVGEVVQNGAFKRSLDHRGGKVPFIDGHKFDTRLGIVFLREDARGLRVERGVINTEKQVGKEALSDLRFFRDHDMPMEMSIGFKRVQSDREGSVIKTSEAKLYEVSLITPGFAANRESMVDGVKAYREEKIAELEQRIADLGCKMEQLASILTKMAPADEPPATLHEDPRKHASNSELAALIAALNKFEE